MSEKPKPVTDAEADESLMNLDTGTVERFTDIASILNMDSACRPKHDGSPELDPTVQRVLMAIVQNPMLPSSQYPKLAGISPNTWQKLRPLFVEKGWIRQQRLQTGSRGRSTLLIEPLEAGIQLANKYKDEEDNHAR